MVDPVEPIIGVQIGGGGCSTAATLATCLCRKEPVTYTVLRAAAMTSLLIWGPSIYFLDPPTMAT